MITDSVHGANLVDVVYAPVPELGDAAEDFVEATKIHRDAMSWDAPGVRMLQTTPEMLPIIARAGQRHTSRQEIVLPPAEKVETTVQRAALTRRSANGYADEPMSLQQVATLLRMSWEVHAGTGPSHGSQPSRPVPSAGALNPLELWLVVRRVDGIDAGLYHVEMHSAGQASLRAMGRVDHDALARAALQEEFVNDAAVTLVISMMPWRSRFKYGQRAVRFALMEAGHAAQMVLLSASAMGLAARPLGGFCDDEVSNILGMCGVDEVPLYLIPVGAAQPAPDAMTTARAQLASMPDSSELLS